MNGPVPFYISVQVNGRVYGIRAAVPDTLQLPIEEKPLDLPLDSRLIIFGQPALGPGDRDANWNFFLMGADNVGARFKIQCRGGPALQRINNGARSLIVPKLVNQLPLLGGAMEYWRLIQQVQGSNQYLIQSTVNGLFWSIPRTGRPLGAVQTQPINQPGFIQVFTLTKVTFSEFNDNRPS
ncbi:hypothetical protein TWF281_008518 [Arthrobotrys megalospora]